VCSGVFGYVSVCSDLFGCLGMGVRARARSGVFACVRECEGMFGYAWMCSEVFQGEYIYIYILYVYIYIYII
jgi:hypothetical protein